ncbi:MAG: sialidase family protein [Planctomycetota bacterium]|nr:sialidase family protein [Planctomycetota bacterium]MDA1177929.1 sialidase family protein [Planctomycetota bacterium]
MRRREFNSTVLGLTGSVAVGLTGGVTQGKQERTPTDGVISTEQMRQEAGQAVPYPKPAGRRNGFDSVNMHEVLVVERNPAVRVKLEKAGKPHAAQLQDGTIVVAGFVEPPIYETSRCTLQYSHDNARTFGEPVLLDLPGRVGGLRCLKNGTLILGHGGGISRSTDGGKTWKTWEFPDDIVPGEGGLVLGECQGAIQLSDGTLMIHLARKVGVYEWEAFVIRSTDDGKTWGDPTRVPTEKDSDEISYEVLPSGRIIGITRSSAAMIFRNGLQDVVPGGKDAILGSEAGDAAYQFYSTDQGRTWSQPVPTGLGVLQAAGAYPFRLRDGRLLLLYGNRQFPYGTQVVGSHDEGRTWNLDHPILLSWHSWSAYCGHPRSVQLHDGTMLTGYYTHRIDNPGDGPPDPARNTPEPKHGRQMTGEVVRWRVPDNWPPKA